MGIVGSSSIALQCPLHLLPYLVAQLRRLQDFAGGSVGQSPPFDFQEVVDAQGQYQAAVAALGQALAGMPDALADVAGGVGCETQADAAGDARAADAAKSVVEIVGKTEIGGAVEML